MHFYDLFLQTSKPTFIRQFKSAKLIIHSCPSRLDVTTGTPGGSTLASALGDVPRKKSRNYLDSHKTIEKKRRDRINTCLEVLKGLVPDCRQYVSTDGGRVVQ